VGVHLESLQRNVVDGPSCRTNAATSARAGRPSSLSSGFSVLRVDQATVLAHVSELGANQLHELHRVFLADARARSSPRDSPSGAAGARQPTGRRCATIATRSASRTVLAHDSRPASEVSRERP